MEGAAMKGSNNNFKGFQRFRRINKIVIRMYYNHYTCEHIHKSADIWW